MKKIAVAVQALALLLITSSAWSTAITCGSAQREATLDSAQTCKTGLGNPKEAEILAHYAGDPWTKKGENAGADGTNDLLTTTTNGWGTNVVGTWAIDASFWASYAEAVISIHVGNGGGDPDHFAWLVTTGETAGTFSYDRLSGTGGGLSNMFLWGRGVGTTRVPEPASIALLLIGVAGLGVARRCKKD